MGISNRTAWLMFLELLFGVLLSIFFLKVTLFGDYSLGKNFLSGFINFYGVLSLVFFFAVFSIGIIGAIRFEQSDKIPRAILYSLIFWVISLVISLILINIISFLSLYVILIGIIAGFNKGLRKNS